jgi:hypothetical protein
LGGKEVGERNGLSVEKRLENEDWFMNAGQRGVEGSEDSEELFFIGGAWQGGEPSGVAGGVVSGKCGGLGDEWASRFGPPEHGQPVEWLLRIGCRAQAETEAVAR